MSNPIVIALIQARLTSQRLPNKVLAQIGPWTALELMLLRLQKSKLINQVVIVTPNTPENARLAEYCRSTLRQMVVEGDEHDVLSRFITATHKFHADYYVRLTADCPFICPEIVDQVIATTLKERAAYGSNGYPPTFPDGFDVECISNEALQWTNQNIHQPHQREHVTYGLVHSEKRPSQFHLTNIKNETGDHSWIRLTLDTPADLVACQKMHQHFQETLLNADHVCLQTAYKELNLAAVNGTQARNEGLELSKANYT